MILTATGVPLEGGGNLNLERAKMTIKNQHDSRIAKQFYTLKM
jgi:hypothetical protein